MELEWFLTTSIMNFTKKGFPNREALFDCGIARNNSERCCVFYADISRRESISMRTRSRALSMPSAARFLSMCAIIILAIS